MNIQVLLGIMVEAPTSNWVDRAFESTNIIMTNVCFVLPAFIPIFMTVTYLTSFLFGTAIVGGIQYIQQSSDIKMYSALGLKKSNVAGD